MVDTTNVIRNMERNRSWGIQDFYLAVDASSSPTYAGTIPLEGVKKVIDNLIYTRDAMVIESWFPKSDPPSFPMSLEELFKNPSLMRTTSVKFSKWLRQGSGFVKERCWPGFILWSGRKICTTNAGDDSVMDFQICLNVYCTCIFAQWLQVVNTSLIKMFPGCGRKWFEEEIYSRTCCCKDCCVGPGRGSLVC